jgi:hypothetical protein
MVVIESQTPKPAAAQAPILDCATFGLAKVFLKNFAFEKNRREKGICPARLLFWKAALANRFSITIDPYDEFRIAVIFCRVRIFPPNRAGTGQHKLANKS